MGVLFRTSKDIMRIFFLCPSLLPSSWLCLSLCLFVSISVWVHFSLYLSLSLSLCFYLCVSVSLSLSLFLYLSISLYLCVSLSLCLSLLLSLSLCLCLSLSLFSQPLPADRAPQFCVASPPRPVLGPAPLGTRLGGFLTHEPRATAPHTLVPGLCKASSPRDAVCRGEAGGRPGQLCAVLAQEGRGSQKLGPGGCR